MTSPDAASDFFDSVEALEAFHQQAPAELLYVLLGDPLKHSLSPVMQNAALRKLGLKGRYVALRVAAEDLTRVVEKLRVLQVAGINVTIPHKQTIIALLDGVDAQSQSYGAINTATRSGDGKYLGHNTDGPGLARAVEESFGAKLGSLRVVLLGAGGAGSALAVQCAKEGCPHVTLVNRTQEKAQQVRERLAQFFPAQSAAVSVAPWNPKAIADALNQADLLINATSVGLLAEDVSVLSPAQLPGHLLVYDTLYRPRPTKLEAAALTAGVRGTGNGLSILLHQGALGLTLWTGKPAPVEVMRRALEEAMGGK